LQSAQYYRYPNICQLPLNQTNDKKRKQMIKKSQFHVLLYSLIFKRGNSERAEMAELGRACHTEAGKAIGFAPE
jgi:hypothetical protein